MMTDDQRRQGQQAQKKGGPSAVVRAARRLFFRERAALLASLSDLVRHRVEAADGLASRSSAGGGGVPSPSSPPSAVLAATDQLLAAGLVTNLIATARELTDQIAEMGGTLRAAEAGADGPSAAGAPVPAPAPAAFGGGLFGSTAPVATAAAVPPGRRTDWDMEHALLGFAHLQRRVASDCLFYLAYHAQLTAGEVCALIDLIRDLTNGREDGRLEGLPLLDPLSGDVPSPYEESDDRLPATAATWQQQQQQHFGGQQWNQWNHHQPPPPRLKDAREWERELVASLWKRGQPQLLQCVSTLIVAAACSLDARHVLVDRESHGPNAFGAGNALFPPQQDHAISASAIQALQPIHQRLDPNSPAAEEAWKRRDIWGLLLVPYALLLRNAAGSQLLTSPRGSPAHRGPMVARGMDVKGTFSKCLMAASQLKSLTFARLSLLPSLSSSSHDGSGASGGGSGSSFEFHASVLAGLVAGYVDALGATGRLPITRGEWFDEEANLAKCEWLEADQKRQFGIWAGTSEEGKEKDGTEGPRAVDLMDRPDCLEDVFALVSSVCGAYPAGAGAFWLVVEERRIDEGIEGGRASSSSSLALSPSRALQTLDLLQSEDNSSLSVYLSFLASLALSDSADGAEGANGAAAVHSFLSGSETINHRAGGERRAHVEWSNIIGSIRWYAERLSQEVVGAGGGEEKGSTTDRIRRSSSAVDTTADSSTSYYYGMGGGSGNNVDAAASSTPERGGGSTNGSSSTTSNTDGPKTKELDEVGRNTLAALLCLVSNVASNCPAAREFILGIRLPATDVNDGSSPNGGGYDDGSLEILFSLLTCTGISPEIMGLAFRAIADVLRGNSAAGQRAWELMELCQFVPIKLLSQYSSFAAGAGSAPRTTSTFTTQHNSLRAVAGDNLPASAFPESTEYGMIYQFEHIESKVGSYPATEGLLYLLSTLVRVAGCPSSLGSQWRLRPGCAPYIEYVTDFILPRVMGIAKDVRPAKFAGKAEECRLVCRALDVVEAVLVRYTIPPVREGVTLGEAKDWHRSNVKKAKNEMGLSPVLSEIFLDVDGLEEEELNDYARDFRNIFLNLQQDGGMPNNIPTRGQLLEASFGEQVPLPKSPGFALLSNLLSTSKGLLFQIIQMLLSEQGGSRGIHECGEEVHSRLLAASLFRETSPNLGCAKEGAVCKAQKEHNLITPKACHEVTSRLRQSMMQPLDCGAALDNAVSSREGAILLSLRILCAAAAREEAFISSLKEAGMPLGVVPTLSFKGPIHGSFAHRFVHEEKIGVSRLSHLLTRVSSQAHGRYPSAEILPKIVDYVGYAALALPHPQGIARNSFSILSYICNVVPHAEAVRSLCRVNDVNGLRVANAFSKGLSMPGDGESHTDLRPAILDLILTNIEIGDSTLGGMNLSLMMLGLSESTGQDNCLDVMLELISDVNFVLDPCTCNSAKKCFEAVYRMCQLGQGIMAPMSNAVQTQRLRWMDKLRRRNFWHAQVACYLGLRGPAVPSVFHEVCNSYRSERGGNDTISKRDTDVLHSISWLLKGLAIELHSLTGQLDKTTTILGGVISLEKMNQLYSLLGSLLSQPDSLILTTLIDMPLGQSSNVFIQERLHSGAPPGEILKDSTRPLPGPAEVCTGYGIIDIERLLSHYQSDRSSSSLEETREWALAWNNFVSRTCVCAHIAQAWSDVTRAALLICSPLVDHDNIMAQQRVVGIRANTTKAIMDIICTVLLRLMNPGNLDVLGQYGIVVGGDHIVVQAGNVEVECAMPLSVAALGLTDILIEISGDSSVEDDGLIVVEEDVARVCTLIVGAIYSCSESSRGAGGVSNNDGRAAVLSCALTQMLALSQERGYSILPPNTPPDVLEIYANAVVVLFRLSTAPVLDAENKNSQSNAHGAVKGAIAMAARSGLSSIFGYLKSIEHQDSVSEIFCSKVFTLDALTVEVHQLVHLIPHGDSDVARLLQQIASVGGVQLLAKSGVTAKLLDFAMAYVNEERRFLSSNIGENAGASQLKPPTLLNGHLSLINTLLSSRLVSSDRVALAVDSYQLLKVYCSSLDRLIQSYPSNDDLTITFIEALCLTYSALKESTGSNSSGSMPSLLDNSTSALERNVVRIAYQLCAFPFPISLLPPLPMALVNVERNHASQLKNITINLGDQSTWWDNIPESAFVGQSMPNPPTGSFDVATRQQFKSYQYGTSPTSWSEGKYQCAISSAKCLEISIKFLISRVHYVAQRDSSSFCVDAVAIAKGICRCSDASRAIQDRLNTLSRPEEDITKMFDASNVMDMPHGNQQLSHALTLEKEYLVQLGSKLGQCAEKLVCLALQDARRMSSFISKPDFFHEWVYFIGALTPALDHTEIETKGVGCAFNEDLETSISLAQGLRKEFEKIKSCVK